jgi:2-phospho-L-lactate/phosphoenolpyruvate guanylyltransferase
LIDAGDIWAVVPVKETVGAKRRLAALVPAHLRETLALSMLEDVLEALAAVRTLAGIVVMTADADAAKIAARHGARIVAEAASGGHTAVIAAAAKILAAERRGGMLQMPADIPLVSAPEITTLLDRHRPAPSFTIVPARDERGSNAVILSPPDAVPLTFGDDSFRPHLDAARRQGIDPQVVKLAGIGLDIDTPEDLHAFARLKSATRTQAFLEGTGFAASPRGQ